MLKAVKKHITQNANFYFFTNLPHSYNAHVSGEHHDHSTQPLHRKY